MDIQLKGEVSVFQIQVVRFPKTVKRIILGVFFSQRGNEDVRFVLFRI